MRLATLTDSGRVPLDPAKSAASVYALARDDTDLTDAPAWYTDPEPDDFVPFDADDPDRDIEPVTGSSVIDPEEADYLDGARIFTQHDETRAGRFGE